MREVITHANCFAVFKCSILFFSYLKPNLFLCVLLTVEAEKKRSEKLEAEAATKIEEDARGENACKLLCCFQELYFYILVI